MFRRFLLIFLSGLLLTSCDRGQVPDMEVILAYKPAPVLSEYGLFRDKAARKPAQGVVSYSLINPLFSDYTDKHRYIYLPPGRTATYRPSDVLDFPIGTVLVKTFAYGETYLETRLLVHKVSGWEAMPYIWNETGTEAVYAPIGKRLQIEAGRATPESPAFSYLVPNKNQCKMCHQNGSDITPIGPKARNLNHIGPYGVNQLADWQKRGLIEQAPDIWPSVPDVSDPHSELNGRARAYLDINCAHCHKATGSASNSGLWLEWEEDDWIRLGLDKHPTAAGRGSGEALSVIKAGAAEDSILLYRMDSSEPGVMMPELGRSLIDDEGVALIREWIAELDPEGQRLTD